MSRPVRVRFAPSPTGYLHVGGARTALYNYLFAKKHNGTFIFRVEDTDIERSTEEAMRMQISDMQWLALNWDEGVDPVTLEDQGNYGPYRQSNRKPIYNKYAQQLIDQGQAYYCFLTDEEIELQREEQKKAGQTPQIKSPFRDMPIEEAKKRVDAGEPAVIRFKVPIEKKDFILNDLIRKEVRFPSDMVGDFVLMRSNGMPVYNFCCAIDDALMEVSHVFRAEEHLSNSLRQLMIFEALGLDAPEFGHLSLILGDDKQKLSKRHGATSCHQYAERGFLPEAMVNFLALMGWSHPEGKEVMPLEELISQFSTERLNPAGAVFDETKLKWMNSVYLRGLPHKELWARIKPFLDKAGIEVPGDAQWQDRSLALFKTSMETLADAVNLYRPIGSFAVEQEAAEALGWESSPAVIQTWIDELKAATEDYLTEEQFGDIQNKVKDTSGVKGKFLFMPIRVAVIGKPHGAELKFLVPLISKTELIRRAEVALAGAQS